MLTFRYPPSPRDVDAKILAPSASFKKQAALTAGSIILFFIVYILLVAAAAALAAACFYFGALLIITMPKIFIILIGLGMMGLGLSVVVFLVKFIFAVSKNENTSRIELKEEDQPQLFSFIRQLSKETGTPFPKKIFITDEVNACVFYNSSFWSMFFPVRKNLEIGLGLVNSLNMSEFKAVIAHEFGHFSQRSMKLGSFTYNVNQVIYNMLYNNTDYNAFLNSWGSINKYMAFFANITVHIATGIQWVLRQMYSVINKSYLGLSRQMEFHADAVSASVSGGNNLISALSRIQLASNCYSSALNNANEWLKQKKATTNIFSNQLSILHSVAKEFKLPLKDGLPEVSYHFMQSFSQSRINYKNQWASHPTLEERKLHLDEKGINVSPDVASAWQVFIDVDSLQEQLTENLYRYAKPEETLEKCDDKYFHETYVKKRESGFLPDVYKGFYDSRFINTGKWDFNSLINEPSVKSFDEIYNDESCRLQAAIDSIENDIATVKAIKEKQLDVKSFDFDGVKHSINDCDAVIKQLEEEVHDLVKKQEANDRESFVYFYKKRNGHAETIKSNYIEYSILYKEFEEYAEVANAVLKTINPFYQGGLSIENINQIVSGLKSIKEKRLKEFFKMLLDKNVINNEANNLADRLVAFNKSDYSYFASGEFRNEELNELSDLALKVADELTSRKFHCYKKMLEEQLS